MEIKDLLELTIAKSASDLHVISGVPPYLRIHGVLSPISGEFVLTSDVIEKYLKQILSAEQYEKFTLNKEIDFSYSFSNKVRFRVNAYTQKGTPAIAFRLIPLSIPTVDELGLPTVLHTFTGLRQGLILVTGPTGHGKSTTLAAMLNEINSSRSGHIVTIEDPIEFIFKPIKCIISQREIGKDSLSWQMALKSVLREDPDVVLIGEMRDYETIASALTVAETGHLVFATLHTNSAAQTIDRIVDVFPNEQQEQVRFQLANVVEAVFSMRLVPDLHGGRVVAYEVMLGTSAVRTAIREGKVHQIDNIIQTSTELGMNTLEMSLAKHVRDGKVDLETAKSYAQRPDELSRLVRVN
ncbi:MAG: type IV pilus twitching motility protein PilT [Patescibacteria group bacterium]|nr:type IV pilus twitching motility protein PilT [Patescibacteria group bacterium]